MNPYFTTASICRKLLGRFLCFCLGIIMTKQLDLHLLFSLSNHRIPCLL